MTRAKPRVVIIGAGMAGLAAANRLHTLGGDSISISILEAGPRIGGRILTSEFSGDRMELGATWIQGIDGSPVYALAQKTNSMSSSDSHERMDGPLTNPITLSEATGDIITPSLVEEISTLYTNLMKSIQGVDATQTSRLGVGAYLRKGLKDHFGSALTPTAEAVFELYVNNEREWTSADDLNDLNLSAECEYKDLPGELITVPKGYSRVVEALASDLPKNVIRLNESVRRVEWGNEDGEVRVRLEGGGGGAVVTCDHVIVTVSLGVLKAGRLEFEPELPEFKRGAVERLGYGVVDKVFVEVDGEGFPFVQLAFDGREEGQVAKVPWWMRRCMSVAPIYGGSRVLLAWFAGKEAMEMEELEEEEVARGVNATWDAFSMNYGRVVRVKRSMWGKNPLFLGSYSYVAVGSSGDDLDLMAEPLPRGVVDADSLPLQVLFAGEATHRIHYSTTHGSYFSGVREADRLLKYLRLL